MSVCLMCGANAGDETRRCLNCGTELIPDAKGEPKAQITFTGKPAPPKGFFRPKKGAMFKGVCRGLQRRYKIPVLISRILFLLPTGFWLVPIAIYAIVCYFTPEYDDGV
jgi:phage shock protein PspC (stress-responsive transcriptional regulator)